jgi:hypothetical protein
MHRHWHGTGTGICTNTFRHRHKHRHKHRHRHRHRHRHMLLCLHTRTYTTKRRLQVSITDEMYVMALLVLQLRALWIESVHGRARECHGAPATLKMTAARLIVEVRRVPKQQQIDRTRYTDNCAVQVQVPRHGGVASSHRPALCASSA